MASFWKRLEKWMAKLKAGACCARVVPKNIGSYNTSPVSYHLRTMPELSVSSGIFLRKRNWIVTRVFSFPVNAFLVKQAGNMMNWMAN
jgi:hypothetical protein